MMPSPIALISSCSAILLVGGAIMYTSDRRARMLKSRMAGLIAAYAPAADIVHRSSQNLSRSRVNHSGFNHQLANFLRIDLARPDLYPAPWTTILPITGVMALILCGVISLMMGLVAWLALPLAWVMISRFVFGRYVSRRIRALYDQMPDALAMIVRSVRAGLPVPEALRVVSEEAQAPTSAEFARLYDDLRVGGSIADCLAALAKRTSLLEYKLFAVSLALQNTSGGSLTETLDNLADVIRKRVALRKRAIALAAEARMTMWTLAILPFLVTAALFVMDPNYIMQLFNTSNGRLILMGGITLLSMGIGSMKIIIKKSVS